MTMSYRVESAGGVASRVNVGGHALLFDQPERFGGQDLGPSPLEVMVASVGACAHYYAAAFLTARKLPVEGLELEIVAEKAKDHPARLASVRVVVQVPDAVPEELLGRMEAAVRACPAHNTLRAALPFEVELRRPAG